jgi:hypothetical protein
MFGRAPMQRPRMTNQNVADLQWDRLQANLTGLDRVKRVSPRHSMRARRHFDGAMLRRDQHQAETDDNCVRREDKVGKLRKERAVIVHVQSLILRAAEGHVAPPLVSDDPVVHESTHDTQHARIEEELRRETRWLEWDRSLAFTLDADAPGLVLRPLRDDHGVERVHAAHRHMALRKTDLIRVLQRSPPSNQPCQYTCHGFSPAIRRRAARQAR